MLAGSRHGGRPSAPVSGLRRPGITSREKLTDMHETSILMHMRTTLIIDDALVERAREMTGIQEKTALVRAGLEALIEREAGRRLAKLAGSQPNMKPIPRRRPA
jgi:Arc/MetJ family transcription regulator